MLEIEHKQKSNISFRYGGTGTDVKIYWENVQELEQKVTELNRKMGSIKGQIEDIQGKWKDENNTK